MRRSFYGTTFGLKQNNEKEADMQKSGQMNFQGGRSRSAELWNRDGFGLLDALKDDCVGECREAVPPNEDQLREPWGRWAQPDQAGPYRSVAPSLKRSYEATSVPTLHLSCHSLWENIMVLSAFQGTPAYALVALIPKSSGVYVVPPLG